MNYDTKTLEELRSLFYKHNDLYYVGDEVLSDDEYNLLFAALVKKEELLPVEQRVTAQVNSENQEGRDLLEHGAPMLSIHTVTDTSEDGFLAFDKSVRNALGLSELVSISYVAEPKYDGLGLSLRYQEGTLMAIAVRGDGKTGQRVTSSVYLFDPSCLPRYLDNSFTGEIRGEGMMSKEVFLEFNKTLAANGEKTKKNPRNAVAGVVRANKRYDSLEGKLIFLPYAIPVTNIEFVSQTATLTWLESFGFKYCEALRPMACNYPNPEGKSPYSYYTAVQRELLGIEIDGIVYKVNRVDMQEELGFREREPRWAVAHKFAPQEVWTNLLDYDISIGRTGVLSVTAKLAPVEVGGVTVESSIMEHFFHIRRLGIRVGDAVKIKRAGDTIPKIVEANPNRSTYVPNIRAPKQCFHCDGPITRAKGFKEHYCRNIACTGRLLNTLIYFASRECMDIRGLGEKTIEELFIQGKIKTPYDIYLLGFKDIEPIIGTSLTNGVMQSIQKSYSRPDWQILTSVGIPSIGVSTAKRLCKEIDLARLCLMDEWEFRTTDFAKYEPHALMMLIEFLNNPECSRPFMKLIEALEFTMVKTSGVVVEQKGRIVLTGSFHKKRTELEKELEDKGWSTSSSVSSKTNYVVVGENPTEHKVATAKNSGIPVMSWNDFVKLI